MNIREGFVTVTEFSNNYPLFMKRNFRKPKVLIIKQLVIRQEMNVQHVQIARLLKRIRSLDQCN